MSSVYRSTLLQALHTTRATPQLWLLGFFAALFGNGGQYELVLTKLRILRSGAFTVFSAISSFFDSGSTSAIGILWVYVIRFLRLSPVVIGVSLLAVCAIIWLAMVAQGAIIYAVSESKKGKKALLRHSIAVSRSYFWHILAVTLVAKITAISIFGIVGLPAIALMQYVMEASQAFSIVFFGLGIPLIVVFAFIIKFAVSYIVIDRLAWKDAYVFALRLFATHWLVSVEMAASLFVISLLGGIFIACGILFISVPFLMLASSFNAVGWVVAANTVLHIARACMFFVFTVLGSILATYHYASWTTLFLKIQEGGVVSKIMRTVHGAREKYN